jgi:hypothetical protein
LARLTIAGAIGTATLFGLATPSTASTVVATMYEHKNHGGAQWNLTVVPNGYLCTNSRTDVDGEIANVTGFWNNRISSFTTFSNCSVKLYENAFFSGAEFGYFFVSLDVGSAMNERASAIRIS